MAGRFDNSKYKQFLQRINNLDKNFITRLKDSNRKSIAIDIDPSNNNYMTYLYPTVGTHLMSYVTDGDNATIFPIIQEINGRLVNTNNPPYDAYKSAITGNDTINTSSKLAEWFTKHYKEYYPNFNK